MRHFRSFIAQATGALFISSTPIVSGTMLNSTSNIAVYWGQNSYGQGSGSEAQQPLAAYCANEDIDIIPMAFMTQITTGAGNQPVLNFANQQNNCTVFEGTDLIDCPSIAADIKTCQLKYGKKILLSIGGSTYTEGGFSGEDAAVNAANLIWSAFGPPSANGTNATSTAISKGSNSSASTSGSLAATQKNKRSQSSALRPFGDAVLDGFDFDFESTVQNTKPFAQQLRALMDQDSSKEYYLTAAPQCPYPDAADNSMLNGDVFFDAIFVQFYNNYCGLQSFTGTDSQQNNFDFSTWNSWAANSSANPNVKIFLGVPAGPSAAGGGYESASNLQPIISYCKSFKSFGGVMMWDASQAYANNGFLEGVSTALNATGAKARRVRRKLAQSWQA